MSPADSPFAQLPAPGPHPATAELRAYAAGSLTPAEEHRIEAHTLDCDRCADLVQGFSMSDTATTDQAVAELRARLQARVGTSEPVPAAGNWAWPRIAAAAAVLGVVAGGIWSLGPYNEAAPPATARLEKAAPATTAPAPAPASAPEIAATPAPTATPETTKSPAYAAVTPSRQPHQRRERRPTKAAELPQSSSADMAVLADEEAPSKPAAVSEATEARAAAPSSARATRIDGIAAARSSPAKSEVGVADKAAADTVANSSEAKIGLQYAKAKKAVITTAADNAATAHVANTPMPAAPAINPAPVGGTPALRDYLRREAAEFEPEENARRLSGTVRVKFIVGADGKVSELKVVRGLRADYDSEALRIVCDGPNWQPGISGGRRAPLPMEVTVPF